MFIIYSINMYIMLMPLIFVKILTHKVPRIWGSCELRITDSRRCHASSSIKCHVISIIPFWGARNQLLLLTSQKCLLLTFKLYCTLRWLACSAVSVNPETLKNIKLKLLYNKKPKRTCVISSRVRVVLHSTN